MRNLKPILLVEDDSVDTMTVKRALKELGVANDLACATNGEEALEYLTNGSNEKPGVILLDLNMPKMNGFEFLKAIKDNEELRRIPIIVLTTSKEERDVIESFELSVAGYMVKPVDYKKFLETIKAIDMYWTLSKLPAVN
ncbi:MAG: response regulator [Planctomycetes bacterium]|nr:response regulator [Planctomycetota bacterium]